MCVCREMKEDDCGGNFRGQCMERVIREVIVVEEQSFFVADVFREIK